MSSLFEENPAAAASASAAGATAASTSAAGATAASTSFAGYGGASTSANGPTKTSNAGAVAIELVRAAAALDSDDDDIDLDKVSLVDLHPVIQNAHYAQRDIDLLNAEFTEAVRDYVLNPGYGITRRADINYDLCMAALDNVLNRHIEAYHPTEETIDFIKRVMHRFYQAMLVWLAYDFDE